MGNRQDSSPRPCPGCAGTLTSLGLESILASRPSRERSLVIAMLVARILQPASKLATARSLQEETATTSLGLELVLCHVLILG